MEFREHFIYNVEFLSIAGGSGTVFSDNTLTISDKSDFSFERTIHTATSDLANLKIQDLKTGRFLFKSQEDLRDVSGKALSGITTTGWVPYYWPNHLRADRLKQIKFSLADNSGSTNTVRIAFHGSRILPQNPYAEYGYDPSEKRETLIQTYQSAAITTAAPLNSKAPGIIQTDSDADFICTKLTGIATGEGLVSIQTAGDNYWQNIPTDTNNLLGNSQFPMRLVTPRFIPKKSTIYIEFTNLTASPNTLTLTFHGYKRF